MKSLRFWRWFSPRSGSLVASKTSDISAIMGISPPPFVAALDRKASLYSRLEMVAGFSVIAGIVAEEWDDFGIFLAHPDWAIGRKVIGGFVVAVGIALEIWFSSRSESAERKVREWYELQVAELNASTERLQQERVKLERLIAFRNIPQKHVDSIVLELLPFRGQKAEVYTSSATVEDEHVGGQIVACLQRAKWITNNPPFSRPELGPIQFKTIGIGLLSTSDELSRSAARALFKAISDRQVDSVSMSPMLQLPRQDDPRVVVIVGDKPLLAPDEWKQPEPTAHLSFVEVFDSNGESIGRYDGITDEVKRALATEGMAVRWKNGKIEAGHSDEWHAEDWKRRHPEEML